MVTHEHIWRKSGEQETVCTSCGFVAPRAKNASKEEIQLGIDWAIKEFGWSVNCSGVNLRRA